MWITLFFLFVSLNNVLAPVPLPKMRLAQHFEHMTGFAANVEKV
jgi:hypothetical protein